LTLDPEHTENTIAADFTGLSYETAQLSDPRFFSGANSELIGLMRQLGTSGVLRIGGNTSAYCSWTPKAEGDAASAADRDRAAPTILGSAVGPDTGKEPAAPRKITRLAVRNLRDFVDAIGWQLIYGLNLGNETPEIAADEAAYVMDTIGSKLIAFQLCNEPDLFSRNGLRRPEYAFAQFAEEWQRFYEVIRPRVPHAPFAGPDTAFNNEWLVPFAQRFKQQVQFLSQHYYAEGPPTDPSMTIERLLRPNPKLDDEFAGMQRTKQESGLPFRMAETNSCYQAGKQGVSDTFASALWGAELMYQLAGAGGMGINFHGGGYGWYTPIAGTVQNGFVARPIYYGLLLFAQVGPGRLIDARLDRPQEVPLLKAYALHSDTGAVKAVVFNKSQDRAVRLTIDPGKRAGQARILRLTAPRLDDTTDVTLGASPVGANGAWARAQEESLALHDGKVTLDVLPASAVLVTFA
jgi:hypothetical protein